MLKNDIKVFFKGDVFDDNETLEKFSRDASIFEVKPKAVTVPKDVEDIKELVKFASQNQEISLTPRSGGTGMSGGSLGSSIIVDMNRCFQEIGEFNKEEGSMITDSGVFYRDFDKETRRRDLFMPIYSASKEICTVGGMVANNSGGEKTLFHGKTDNFVLELMVVLSDGNEYLIKSLSKEELETKMQLDSFEGKVYQQMYELTTKNEKIIQEAKPNVTKNSAGYALWNIWDGKRFDLTKLFVGSQGTLGIITKIKFRLVPIPKVSKTIIVFLRDLKKLGNVVSKISNHKPDTLEFYDDNTLKLGIRFFSRLWRLLTKQISKMVIMAEFVGNSEDEILKKLKEVEVDLRALKVKSSVAKSKGKFWVIRSESFNLLRKKIKGLHATPFIDDVVVKPEVFPEFLLKLKELLGQYKLKYAIFGHPGDGNLHIIPLMNLSDPQERSLIPKLCEKVYDLVLEYKGSITAEHNDGLIRTPYLLKMYGQEVISLFEKTKEIFDSKNVFNPGKKVNATSGFAMSHIKTNWRE